MRFTVLCVVASLAVAHVTAGLAVCETIHDARVWISFTGQGRLSHASRWRWYFDVQNRDRNTGRDIDQFVLRPGVGFALSDRSSVWAGYAYTANFTSSGKVYENRTWQQFVWTTASASLAMSSRSRVEQRLFEGESTTAWRIRQQVRVTQSMQAHPALSLIGWDEILYHLNTTSRSRRGFDQNRAFGGVGFKLRRTVRLDLGYLNQFVHASPANRMNHALSAVVNLTF
jgi:hypothetical protein